MLLHINSQEKGTVKLLKSSIAIIASAEIAAIYKEI